MTIGKNFNPPERNTGKKSPLKKASHWLKEKASIANKTEPKPPVEPPVGPPPIYGGAGGPTPQNLPWNSPAMPPDLPPIFGGAGGTPPQNLPRSTPAEWPLSGDSFEITPAQAMFSESLAITKGVQEGYINPADLMDAFNQQAEIRAVFGPFIPTVTPEQQAINSLLFG